MTKVNAVSILTFKCTQRKYMYNIPSLNFVTKHQVPQKFILSHFGRVTVLVYKQIQKTVISDESWPPIGISNQKRFSQRFLRTILYFNKNKISTIFNWPGKFVSTKLFIRSFVKTSTACHVRGAIMELLNVLYCTQKLEHTQMLECVFKPLVENIWTYIFNFSVHISHTKHKTEYMYRQC